jgi:hypothetical protein
VSPARLPEDDSWLRRKLQRLGRETKRASAGLTTAWA